MKDGGSAFPVFEAKRCDADYDMTEPGMSLRDWFAGQALNAVITRPNSIEDFEEIPEYVTAFVKAAYEIADAMIAAREDNNADKQT